MEKNTYQSMMSHVRMSESCEEEILRKAEEASVQPEITMKTRKKRSPAMIAAAACLCAAVAGTVTVSAVQENGWVKGFFGVPEWVDESVERKEQREQAAAYAEKYISPISNFAASGWNAEKFEPVGAVCDGENIYVAVRYTTPLEDGVATEYMWDIPGTFKVTCDGQSVSSVSSSSGSWRQDDGSAIIYMKHRLSEFIRGDSIDVSMDVVDSYNLGDYDNINDIPEEKICSLSFSVDIVKKTKVVTYYTDEILKKEIQPLGVNACAWVEKVEVSTFNTVFSGESTTANRYDIGIDPVYIVMEDGTKIECIGNYSGSYGLKGEYRIVIEHPQPVDPEAVTAVIIGKHTIELG